MSGAAGATRMPPAEVVFTVNSPGEVATWLAPAVHALRAREPEPARLRVTVLVLPCMYAAGTELTVVQSIPGVDCAFGPRASLRFALTGTGLAHWRPRTAGVVVYLGGEVALAARIADRLRYGALIYTEGYISRPSRFARVLVPNERARCEAQERGADPAAVALIGDLMVDAAHLGVDEPPARIRAGWGLDPAAELVALFPGSRPFELRRTLRLFIEAAQRIAASRSGAAFVLALSPFQTEASLRAAFGELGAVQVTAGDPGRLFAGAGGSGAGAGAGANGAGAGGPVERFAFRTERGAVAVLFVRGGARRVMAAADLALTVPGSNTAEMAAHGLPMVVCVPLDRLEEIPVDGVFGLVGSVPVVGRRLKVAAVRRLIARTRFSALPNRAAGRFLVPELRSENLQPADVAAEALRFLQDKAARAAVGEELRRLAGPPGASARLAECIFASLGSPAAARGG